MFYQSGKSRPRPCILGQFSMQHIAFCPTYVPAFPGLGLAEGGIYFDWRISPSDSQNHSARIKMTCGVCMTSLLLMYDAAILNALFIIKMAELRAYRDQHFRVM